MKQSLYTLKGYLALSGLLVLLAACDSAQRPDPPAANPSMERSSQPIARIHDGQPRFVQDQDLIKDFLATRYAQGTRTSEAPALDQVWIETGAAHTYLMARGKDGAGRCLTLAAALDVQDNLATLAKTEAGVIFIEACLSPDGTCPQSGCITTKDDRGKITDCMCIPTGNCQRVVIPVPIVF